MKYLLSAALCLLMATGTIFAQDKPENPNMPQFDFKKGDTHDFGTIPEGPQVEYEFEFTNTGKEPLIVQQANADCGCTTPTWPKAPILPGQTGKIRVAYTTQGHVGPFNKNIYILSNGFVPNGGDRYELHIKGNVLRQEDYKNKK